MDIIRDSVKKLEEILRNCGYEDGGVCLDVKPEAVNCLYEKGACMTASFGGRSSEFVTGDPIRAQTLISFMFDAPLDTPATRGAASAVVNVVTGFFCLSRTLHACPAVSHLPCLEQLKKRLSGRCVCCIGRMPAVEQVLGRYAVVDPRDAEVILINGEGLISDGTGDIVVTYRDSRLILCLGPSTAGTARIQKMEHWCPYGT